MALIGDLELILPHCTKTLVPDSCRIYDRVFFCLWNEERDDYVTMLGHDKAKKWLKHKSILVNVV